MNVLHSLETLDLGKRNKESVNTSDPVQAIIRSQMGLFIRQKNLSLVEECWKCILYRHDLAPQFEPTVKLLDTCMLRINRGLTLDQTAMSMYLDAMGRLGTYEKLEETWSFLKRLRDKGKCVITTNHCTSYVEALFRLDKGHEAGEFVFGGTSALKSNKGFAGKEEEEWYTESSSELYKRYLHSRRQRPSSKPPPDDIRSLYNVQLDAKFISTFFQGYRSIIFDKQVLIQRFKSKWPDLDEALFTDMERHWTKMASRQRNKERKRARFVQEQNFRREGGWKKGWGNGQDRNFAPVECLLIGVARVQTSLYPLALGRRFPCYLVPKQTQFFAGSDRTRYNTCEEKDRRESMSFGLERVETEAGNLDNRSSLPSRYTLLL